MSMSSPPSSALDIEALVERKKLQRRLSFWRIIAVLIVLGLITTLIFSNTYLSSLIAGKGHIARVAVSGMIRDDRTQYELLAKLAKDPRVKAVILDVNSTGGTTTGGEGMYEAITKLRQKKPVVAVFGTVAASAAYIVGLATDRIVARGNTITGSVGVIFLYPEVSELLQKLGIKMNEIKSGPLKATPSPFSPANEASKDISREMVMDGQKWFLDLVTNRRKIDPQTVPGLVDGRVYSGRQAKTYKLIDQIGAEAEAVQWLEKEKKIETGLTIIDWKARKKDDIPSITGMIRALSGQNDAVLQKWLTLLASKTGLEQLQLDGLLSVWHPSDKR